MLRLRRKKEQKVRINDDITVKVLDIFIDNVVLGFEAQREIPVHRGEAYHNIQKSPEIIERTEFKEKIRSLTVSREYLQAHEMLETSEIPYQVTSYRDSLVLHELAMGLGALAKSALEAKLFSEKPSEPSDNLRFYEDAAEIIKSGNKTRRSLGDQQ